MKLQRASGWPWTTWLPLPLYARTPPPPRLIPFLGGGACRVRLCSEGSDKSRDGCATWALILQFPSRTYTIPPPSYLVEILLIHLLAKRAVRLSFLTSILDRRPLVAILLSFFPLWARAYHDALLVHLRSGWCGVYGCVIQRAA